MSKLPSDATLDIINKLAGGGWNGTVRISVDAEWNEGNVTLDAPEQADPDNSSVFINDDPVAALAELMHQFNNIKFDDYHDIDFSDAQKENLLVHVRGSGGEGGGGRG